MGESPQYTYKIPSPHIRHSTRSSLLNKYKEIMVLFSSEAGYEDFVHSYLIISLNNCRCTLSTPGKLPNPLGSSVSSGVEGDKHLNLLTTNTGLLSELSERKHLINCIDFLTPFIFSVFKARGQWMNQSQPTLVVTQALSFCHITGFGV